MHAADPAPPRSPGPAATAHASQAPTGAVFAALVLLLVLSGLDQTVLSTALPSILAELGDPSLGPWVFTSYLLASTAVIPLYGKLADRWGVRPMLLLASALFTLGSLACALSGSLAALVAARTLQGLGGGGLLTLTMLAMAALYPLAERGRRMGLLGAAYGLSTLVGPMAGGLLLEVAAWPWAFLINVPCAALAVAVLLRSRFGQARPEAPPLDWAGALLLASALVLLLLATRHDLGPRASLIAAGSGLAAAGGWLLTARRAADPVLPMQLFVRPAFAAASLISTATGVTLFAAVVFLPLYLQHGLGLSALGSAAHTFPLMLGITIAAQLTGRALRAGRGLRPLARQAAVLSATGYAALAALLALVPGPGWATWALSAALLPVGLGLGLLFPLVTVVAQRSAPPAQLGVATAAPVMLRSLGGAVGVALLGDVLNRHLAAGGHADAVTALAGGVARLCAWAAAVAALTWLAARALPTAAITGPAPDGTGSPAAA